MQGRLTTSRLHLVLATAPLLSASLRGGTTLAEQLGAEAPADWPPEHIDEGALRWSLSALESGRAPPPWGFYFMLQRATTPLLIGTCGFKGAPDAAGTVEVGYSVVPSAQRQGYATEAIRALIECAFASGANAVAAETLPHLAASLAVMEKCGMQPVECASAPGVLRRQRARAA